ncbi:hypothetical protein [Azospirillum sp.]|uniref:hypothetical protein n=1 Tax=Azospirillum sp. TaxID=34012 RepID=UPI002D2FF85F|nr:hypothetical protein [Azospirillum sp.]HYF89019.1 hypothetical protein [Azospirillum sp.]
MTDTHTTALSPEELAEACIADMDGCTYRGRVDAIAAAIRQHSADKDRQIEVLTADNEWLRSAHKASSTGQFSATERAETAEAALSASLERERAMREALRKCISPYAGYAIQNDSQAVDVMKGFYAHIREVDGIARAALQPQEATDWRPDARQAIIDDARAAGLLDGGATDER